MSPRSQDQIELKAATVENEHSPLASQTSLSQAKLSISDRLSTKTFLLLFLGILGTAGVVTALAFMWWGNRENETWRRIVLANYLTRMITLSALLVRVITSSQAVICTSMLAAAVLEGREGIPLPSSATISLARYSSTSPWDLMMPLFRAGFRRAEMLRVLLLLIYATTTTILQFSSTILLSDVGLEPVRGPIHNATSLVASSSNVLIGSTRGSVGKIQLQHEGNSQVVSAADPWDSYPASFPAFAEYHEPNSAPREGILDTGTTLRALLPLQTQARRLQLQEYNGDALLFDSRVACSHAKVIDATLSFRDMRLTGFVQPTEVIDGLFSYKKDRDGLHNFDCPLTFNVQSTSEEDSVMICSLPSKNGGLISTLDPFYSYHRYWLESQRSWMADGVYNATNNASPEQARHHITGPFPAGLGNAHLIIKVLSFPTDLMDSDRNSSRAFDSPSDWQYFDEGVWQIMRVNNGYAKLSVTLCYDALYPTVDYKVKAMSNGNRTEPEMGWNRDRNRFDTSHVRLQLGAPYLGLKLQERGIMQFGFEDFKAQRARWHNKFTNDDDPPNEDTKNLPPTGTQLLLSLFLQLGNRNINGIGISMCNGCFTGEKSSPSTHIELKPQLSTIFMDTLNDTRNPALALQAHLTTIVRMAYYAMLPTFDMEATHSEAVFEFHAVPRHGKGLSIVLSILAIHLLAISSVIWLYCSTTMYTRLNNVWQVLAQTASPGMQELLSELPLKTDKEVREWLEGNGHGMLRIKLEGDGVEGRSGLVIIPNSGNEADHA